MLIAAKERRTTSRNINYLAKTSMIGISTLLVGGFALALHSSEAFVLQNVPSTQTRDSVPLSAASYLETLANQETSTSSRPSSPPRTQQQSGSPARTTPTSDPIHRAAPDAVKLNTPPAHMKVVELNNREPLGSTVAPAGHSQRTGPAKVAVTAETPVKVYEEYGDINSEVRLAESSFPFKGDELITLAKEAVFLKGLGLNDAGACLADDFSFRGSQVESKKPEFLQALKTFNLGEFFYIKQQYFGWIADPIQLNRVWFMNRQEATHIKDFFGARAEGRKLVLPPESLHVDFNELGQVKEFGFYTVDRFQGNTGGLGGAFGYFYGVGKPLPFPEGHPYRISRRRRLFEALGAAMSQFQEYRTATLKPALKRFGETCVSCGSKCVKAGASCVSFISRKFSRDKELIGDSN